MIRVLLAELGIEERVLAHMTPRKEVIGLGMTDSGDYASLLADKFAYKNTFLHEEPMLDIGASHLPKELEDRHDFVICSEVLEHVTPPVDRAFKNIFQILKSGGILVLTVPYGLQETTLEHFPDLNEFQITNQAGDYTLRNVTKDGVTQEFHDLVFHGGPGMTLEMRVFAEKDLLRRLEKSGFSDVKVHRRPDLTCAAWWPEPWSLPISARRPSEVTPPLATFPSSCTTISESSGYSDKVLMELTNFQDIANVHALPDIYHYWSNKHLLPKITSLGFESLDQFFLHYIIESAEKVPKESVTIVSFGSGNCDFEIGLAVKLIQRGVTNFHFTCLELNQAMLDRGRELALERSCSTYFTFGVCDLNHWRADEKIDIALAVHSLHHVVALESLFDQISSALSHDGSFLINDMIGRNGHQRWDEALEVVEKFWADLPRSYKYNHPLRRFDDQFVNWDCSTQGFEGIRAQDILPELIKRFGFEVFLGFSNVIDVFVDRAFGRNFNCELPEDREFIDRVAQEDDHLIEAGVLKPTHLIAALKHRVVQPRFYKNLTPEFCVRWPTD